jgi:hypothetical protein
MRVIRPGQDPARQACVNHRANDVGGEERKREGVLDVAYRAALVSRDLVDA